MRIAIVGGGPGGLFLATLLGRGLPGADITVFERNRAEDTFGFGVVFSDRTLAAIHDADPVLREALEEHGRHWDVIEVRLKGELLRCAGNGMAAVVRHTLLALMQQRARAAGARLRFCEPVGLADVVDADLVVAADGTGSTIREQLPADLGESVETASAKFIWFGTDYLFDGLTFLHERGPHGVFAVHGYPISQTRSTFIVETDEASWRAAGLDGFDLGAPPGESDMVTKRYLEELFAEQIEGRSLLVNNSRWGNFRTRRTSRWHTLDPVPVALLGDAVHTAHFSVGSGTKMAMEDAIALAAAIMAAPDDLPAALAAYERAAQPSVGAIQQAARPSLAWWEHFGRYHDFFEPWQFAYHFLTRSIGDARLARRDPGFVAAAHRRWRARYGAEVLDSPLEHAGLTLAGRVVDVSFSGGLPVVAAGLPLLDAAPQPTARPWAARLAAPAAEADLPAAFARLARLADGDPAFVAVHGGSVLTRMLSREQARMHHKLPALAAEEDLDDDAAVTAVLSGRADLVARPTDRAVSRP